MQSPLVKIMTHFPRAIGALPRAAKYYATLAFRLLASGSRSSSYRGSPEIPEASPDAEHGVRPLARTARSLAGCRRHV